MRTLVLVMVVLGGCVADAEEPPPVITLPDVEATTIDPSTPALDVCALASELPAEDICSLMCDPGAMVQRMVSDGSGEPGACYQLYCSLPNEAHVLVGVCVPPP